MAFYSNQPNIEVPNAALREIAGRLHKLSYRDLSRFAELLHNGAMGITPAGANDYAALLLECADMLERE